MKKNLLFAILLTAAAFTINSVTASLSKEEVSDYLPSTQRLQAIVSFHILPSKPNRMLQSYQLRSVEARTIEKTFFLQFVEKLAKLDKPEDIKFISNLLKVELSKDDINLLKSLSSEALWELALKASIETDSYLLKPKDTLDMRIAFAMISQASVQDRKLLEGAFSKTTPENMSFHIRCVYAITMASMVEFENMERYAKCYNKLFSTYTDALGKFIKESEEWIRHLLFSVAVMINNKDPNEDGNYIKPFMTFLPTNTGPIIYTMFCGGLFTLSENQRDEVFEYLEQKRSEYSDNPAMLYEYLNKGAIECGVKIDEVLNHYASKIHARVSQYDISSQDHWSDYI